MKGVIFFSCLAVLLSGTFASPFTYVENGSYRFPYFSARTVVNYFLNMWSSGSNPFLRFYNYYGVPDCTIPNLSFEEKLDRIIDNYNTDGNGIITPSDLIYNAENGDDANKDGVVTEAECVRSRLCLFGDYTQKATFICALLLRGEANITIDAIRQNQDLIAGVTLDEMRQRFRDRYAQFSNRQCVDRCLSREERLSRNADNNDYNNDGLVTSDDVRYDLTNFYDQDGDGLVTKEEWVLQWLCFYGDSGDYARYLFEAFSQGATAISATSPPFEVYFGESAAKDVFKSAMRQNYANFYQTRRERTCYDSTRTTSYFRFF